MFIAAQAQVDEEGREALMDAASRIGQDKQDSEEENDPEESRTHTARANYTPAQKEPEIGSYEALMAAFGGPGGFQGPREG